MSGQRVVAILLTLLFAAFVLTVFVFAFGLAGHPVWGWFVGAGFLIFMVYGFVREQRRSR